MAAVTIDNSKERGWKMENGAESGAEEESKCLGKQERGKGSSAVRFGAMREHFIGDTRLSNPVRLTLVILVVLCISLLIVVIALAVCWPNLPYAKLLCNTPACLTLSANYLQWMNGDTNNLEECSEPRRWACGKWLDNNEHRLPARSSWSFSEEIRLQDLRRLRDILTTMLPSGGSDSLDWKLKTLYESCMKVEHIEGADKLPLEALIRRLGGWRVTRTWSPHAWSWREILKKLHTEFSSTPLFAVSLTWGVENKTLLDLRPAGLGLPHPSFYMTGSESKPVKAYKALLKDAALNLDASTADAVVFADDVFSFEHRLATLIYDDNKQRLMTMKELNDSARFMPFLEIIHAIFPRGMFSNNTEILVTAPSYITHLSSITTSTDPSILNAYFTWTLIKMYLPYMSTKFRLIWREFQTHLTGSTEDLPRWEFCANFVQQVAPLASVALLETDDKGNYFLKSNFTENAVQNMFATIKNVALETVTSSNNIDGHTKTLMLEQLNRLNLQIGLKPNEKTQTFLNNYYKGLFVQIHDFFQNVIYSHEFERGLLQSSFEDKNYKITRENAQYLTQPRASYNSHTITIIVPTSLVTPPYYHTDYPRSVQYGRLGVSIATAMTNAMAIKDPEEDTAIPRYASSTVYCLNNLLEGTVHESANSEPAMAASASYLHVIGSQLAMISSRHAQDEHPLLPRLETYNGDSLFALAFAQTLCSMHIPDQAVLNGINLHLDGETMFKVVWPQIRGVREALNCKNEKRCPNPL